MKTLIIGGGMAGMTYGILAARNGIETTICERNARCGKKISQSGNGKCNIGNIAVSASCFNSSAIAKAVCEKITLAKYIDFLKSCDIYTFADDHGRMYPLSENANSVVDCLRFCYEKLGGKFLFNTDITSVKRLKNGLWSVSECEDTFDKIVVACGSGSSSVDPKISAIVPQKYFTGLVPSLVPLKILNSDRRLNGLRTKANVSLLCDGTVSATEYGEVQFKDYGVSGICIFNLSAYIARKTVLGELHRYSLILDLVPEMSLSSLSDILQSRLDRGISAQNLFLSILHNMLAQSVLERVLKDLSRNCDDSANSGIAKKLSYVAKNYVLDVDRLLDFSKSQVTAGGISEKYINLKDLTLPNGIVAIGEVLDVDGLCGGNNLYFAAASALYLFE